jgi:hypothetical protein
MSNIIIIDTLATSVKGMSVQAYRKDEGWSRDHVFQRAVIDESHESHAELVSITEKAKQAKATVEMLFNAWVEGNEHLKGSLGHDLAMWVNKIAHDGYDSVTWSDIIDVGERKVIRSQFKHLAKSDCAKLFRLYKRKECELKDKINADAIKFVDAHVTEEVNKLKEQIRSMIIVAFCDANYAGAEVHDLRQNSYSTGWTINYAILHDDFMLNLDQIAEREARGQDKVASTSLILSVAFEGDGRQNYRSGAKDCSISEVSIGHVKKHIDENQKEVRYIVEEDTVRIRNGNSDVRFHTQDAKQLKRVRFLLNALLHLMSIKHTSVWARQDWMNDVLIIK